MRHFLRLPQLLFLSAPLQVLSEMPSTDRDLLLTLYRSAGAEANLPNWDTDADISDWEGVGVNDEGRVVELQLPFRNLRGTLCSACKMEMAMIMAHFGAD